LKWVLFFSTTCSFISQGLSYLIDVDVSGNRLRTIAKDAFSDNPGLITFEARRNKAFEGPSESGTLIESRTLQTLDLADCSISVVGAQWFIKSPALRKIILSGNPIHTVAKDAFSSLQGLEELHLSRTQIRRLSASDLGLDPPLRTLYLNHNRLEADALKQLLSGLKHLETLEVRDAQLQLDAGQPDIFTQCQWLRKLDASGNDLSQWDAAKGLGSLRQLEHLDLDNCGLTLPASDAWVNLTRLRSLTLSGNSLMGVNVTELLRPLHKLQTLALRGCQLRTTDFLRRLPKVRESLRALDLSDNPLGDAEVNAAGSVFMRLEALNVSRCQLTSITPAAFSSAHHLVSLALSGNGGVRIQNGALAALTRLERVEADDCALSAAPPSSVFPPNCQLTELHLAGNPLKGNLVPAHLAHLQVLDASRCGLRNISATSLAGARNLVRLDARGNDFAARDFLPPDLAAVAPKLELLDLRGSNVGSVDAKGLRGCAHLKAIYLEDNPLRCDCDMSKSWRWATSKGVALHERKGGARLRCLDQTLPWPKPLETLQC
jgi:insulin-like growth factor-binding protein complex acid labile subunit